MPLLQIRGRAVSFDLTLGCWADSGLKIAEQIK